MWKVRGGSLPTCKFACLQHQQDSGCVCQQHAESQRQQQASSRLWACLGACACLAPCLVAFCCASLELPPALVRPAPASCTAFVTFLLLLPSREQ